MRIRGILAPPGRDPSGRGRTWVRRAALYPVPLMPVVGSSLTQSWRERRIPLSRRAENRPPLQG
jgi:hypothetical protein